jgi:hypothetical protein
MHIGNSIQETMRTFITLAAFCAAVVSTGVTAASFAALPLTYTNSVLTDLDDSGRASGYLQRTGSLPLPLSVSVSGLRIASAANFFGSDAGTWTVLRTAAANNRGVTAGLAIAAGQSFAWTWNGTLAIRLPVPPSSAIDAVVGPADNGSLAATVYDAANAEQQLLYWQASGSRSVLYRTAGVKTGMQLFGMSSSGIIGAVERDGILLTLTLYDGQWYPLSFDYLNCGCDALRVNARGQVLVSPRSGASGDPRGYLLSRSGATLLPRVDAQTRYADLNDLGDVVGNAIGGPFVIMDGLLHDLNQYAGSAAAGWRLLTAVAINNGRQIVGTGIWRGRTRWYLLSLR